MKAALEALFSPPKEEELPADNEIEDIPFTSFPPELVAALQSEFSLLYLSGAAEEKASEPKRTRQQTYSELLHDFWQQGNSHVAHPEEDSGALQLTVESEPAGATEPMCIQPPASDSVRVVRSDSGDDAVL